MHIAVVGVGGAGGRIVDALASRHGTGGSSPLASVQVVDTDRESLAELESIPSAGRHAIGQYETGGTGTDGDRNLGETVAAEEGISFRREVEDGIRSTAEGTLLVAGVGGGTGATVTPALAAGLSEVYEFPVYTVSVLPASSETPDEVRANAAHGLTELAEHVDAQILFDNDVWLRDGASLSSSLPSLNGLLLDRLSTLLQLGGAGSRAEVGQRAVDTSDVLGTLDGGGYATLGAASRSLAAWRGASIGVLDRLHRRVLGDDTDPQLQETAVRRTLAWATRGTMSFECPRDAATHGLVVFSGPPDWLRGDAIAGGRDWLAERADLAELRSGDVPRPGADSLGVFLVLAGIRDAPRLQELRNAE